MEETWGWEMEYPGMEKRWESGFESEDDANDAMDEAMTELINEIAEKYPELSDKEIEDRINWSVRPE